MASFFDDPDSEPETSYSRPAPGHGQGQARASSSRARSTTAGYGHGHGHDSIAPTSPSSRSRTFSLVPGTETETGDDESMSMSVRNGMDMESTTGIGEEDDLDLEGEGDEGNDVKRLGRVWVKERGMGDIVAWEGDLMDTLFDKLEQQQKMVNTLRSDPDTSEEEHFKLMLVMTEMERVKYLVRSYVRTRLHKIEKYSDHIVASPELHHLLSGAELQHAKRYTELLHTHFQHSVLESLPEWLRKMDDTYGDGLSMVSKPNPNLPVLVYCRRDCGEITLEDGERAALAKGTTHLVKYRFVEQWIKLDWAEVL